MTTLDPTRHVIAALRQRLSHCLQRAAGPLQAHRCHPDAYLSLSTRDDFLDEARATREVITAWERMETAWA